VLVVVVIGGTVVVVVVGIVVEVVVVELVVVVVGGSVVVVDVVTAVAMAVATGSFLESVLVVVELVVVVSASRLGGAESWPLPGRTRKAVARAARTRLPPMSQGFEKGGAGMTRRASVPGVSFAVRRRSVISSLTFA